MLSKLINYKASRTARVFHQSDAFVRGIMGPFGSGKSVAMCWEIFMRAKQQTPGTDGKRKSRWLVVRNTQPQLETTTIKTWLDWFPEEIFGKMNRKPPFSHHIKMGDIDLEVIFLALDKPDDVKKLLSFEVTGVWFNEAREIEYSLIAGATGRVGRYPSKKDKPDNVSDSRWPAWCGIIMDTNPPTDDHWWYKMAELNEWAVDERGKRVDPSTIPANRSWNFWKQPSGLSDEAENIENLPNGRNYYLQQLGGKTQEWINVYVHGDYGFIEEGLPVYSTAWNADIHTAQEPIDIPPSGTIYVGVDASGRHPAAVFLAKTYDGKIRLLHELYVSQERGIGAENFARVLKHEMHQKFPNHDFQIWGDPAGSWGSQNDERTYFDILRANGVFIKPSPGLRIPERVETVITVLCRMVGGEPAFLVSPTCKMILRGFNGGYKYRRLNTSGGGRYDQKPEKNEYADPQDALQYVLCGMGEMSKMYGKGQGIGKTVIAKSRYSI